MPHPLIKLQTGYDLEIDDAGAEARQFGLESVGTFSHGLCLA